LSRFHIIVSAFAQAVVDAPAIAMSHHRFKMIMGDRGLLLLVIMIMAMTVIMRVI
jgi:hypothetical protein